ncbi:ABC transporter permease [Acidobacteriota bacterium]
MNEKRNKPPRLAEWILKKVANEEDNRAIVGDFKEEYIETVQSKGAILAYLRYWLVFSISFPSFIYSFFYWRIIMFRYYLKITFRNIKRYKGYSFINITGLSIGIFLFLLIIMFVKSEFSYDRFNENFHRIYRVGSSVNQTSMAPGVAKEIAEQIPDVEKVTRARIMGDYFVSYRSTDNTNTQKTIKIPIVRWADHTFFDIFSLEMISGDPKTALADPASLVLTESMAKRIFNNEDPVGTIVQVNNAYDVKVTGVIKDPKNFHLTFDALGSYISLSQRDKESLDSWNTPTYILLPENHNQALIENQITELFTERLKDRNPDIAFFLTPLKDIYFGGGSGKHGNRQTAYIFLAVAFFILLIACINFVNLSTARASVRAKEVGLRKVVGSNRGILITQFLGESTFFTLLAFLISMVLLGLFLPSFNTLIEEQLTFSVFFDLPMIMLLVCGIVLVGITAGLYPAFYLSAFHPSTILNGEKTKGKKSILFRRILIVFQFAISVVLIIGTITVFKQLQYMKNRDLGFQKEQVLLFDLKGDARKNQDEFRQKLLQSSYIQQVSFSQGFPGRVYNWESFDHEDGRQLFAVFTVDPDYFDVYGFVLEQGRLFSWDQRTDMFDKCIMNEAAVRVFGLDSPVGKVFNHTRWQASSFPRKQVEVIGVVKDFHFASLHQEIQPLVFSWNPGWLWMANVRLSSTNIQDAMSYIQKTWKEIVPGFPFEFSFMDERFDRQYKRDERFGKIFTYFAGLGILIAALGLFGLASFMAEQRTKEIGIRKVLGASVGSILVLLSKEFTKWVFVAIVIAWPVAYFVMNKWLENFAYRIQIGVLIFIVSTCLALLVALVTVFYQAARAATANPVDSLRCE